MERVQHLAMGESGGHEADPGVARVRRDPVDVVVDAVLPRERQAYFTELALDLEHARRTEELRRRGPRPRPAVDVHARHHGVAVQHRQLDGSRSVGDRRDDLHRRPQPGRPRHRHRMQAEFQAFGHGAGIEDRHVQVDERRIGRRRHRRRLARRVVTDECHRAAERRRSGEHPVAERVTGSIETGRLAVPDAHDAVVACVGSGGGELRTHHGRRTEFFVHGRLVDDGEIVEQFDRLGDLEVETAER